MHRQVRGLILLVAMASLAACAQKTSTAVDEAPLDKSKAFQVDAKVVGEKLELTIAAKQGFKLNDEYPHSFRPAPEGVKFASDRIELWDAAAKIPCTHKAADTCSMTSALPFEGTGVAEGIAAFSVCDANLCLIEKVPVSVVVAAK